MKNCNLLLYLITIFLLSVVEPSNAQRKATQVQVEGSVRGLVELNQRDPKVTAPPAENDFVSAVVKQFEKDLNEFHAVELENLKSQKDDEVPDIVRKHQRLLQPTETGIQIQSMGVAASQAEENVLKSLQNVRLTESASRELTSSLNSAKLRFFSLIFNLFKFCWPLHCNSAAKYRTIDGTCNNLAVNTHWGQAERPHNRWLPAAYQDFFGCRRPRVNGVSGPLPNARQVSRVVHDTLVFNHPHITHMVMQWGQFLDHDITLTPMFSTYTGSAINCDCNPAISNKCFPIDLDITDPLHDVTGNNGCIRMARSKPAFKCNFWNCVREQENEITSYIDASNVYGSSASVANSLKDGSDLNKLKVETPGPLGGSGCPVAISASVPTNCKHFLPNAGDPNCTHCFKAGDIRNSEQPALASMHTIWVREHNWVVDQLNATGFNGNKYEEARRIVGAMHQHITYNEFLRAVLGNSILASNDLAPLVSGYSTYDKYCDATINNEFATAAYRFGHSLIQGMLEIIQNFDYSAISIENLHENFSPDFLIGDIMNIDKLLNGVAHQHSQEAERYIDEDVRDRLFASLADAVNQFGMDLAALNIQRAREHGIPSYVAYRALFYPSGTIPSTFFQLGASGLMSWSTVIQLGAVYSNVADIDLFTGLLAETPVGGAIVGPLLAEMLVTQFKALKDCDRYYYEHGGQAGTFNHLQLKSIRSVTLAQVMCRNLPHLHQAGSLQQNVFLKEDPVTNKRLDCADILATGGVRFDFW